MDDGEKEADGSERWEERKVSELCWRNGSLRPATWLKSVTLTLCLTDTLARLVVISAASVSGFLDGNRS